MRNGFWLCIAAAVAVTAIAVPAASAAVVRYDTELTITTERHSWYLGDVLSERDHNPGYDPANAVRKCERGRRVIVLKQVPGADRKFGTDRSNFEGVWFLPQGLGPPLFQARVYAKVKPKVRDGFVCRADRSPTI